MIPKILEMTGDNCLACCLLCFYPHPLVLSTEKITLTGSLVLNKGFISMFKNRNIFRLVRRFWWETVVYLKKQSLGKALRCVSEKSWRVWVSSVESRRVCSEQNCLSRRNWGGTAAFGQEILSYSQKHLGDSWYIIDVLYIYASWFTGQKGLKNWVRNPTNPLGEGVAWNRQPLKEEQFEQEQKAEENL